MTIGERIKTLRKSLNYSQEDFGKMIGLSRSAICGVENETRNIPDRTVKLIASIFNVSESWLRTGIEDKIFEQWDTKENLEKIHNEINTIEQIQNTFGKDHVIIFESFDKLNTKGKQKAIEVVDDLTLIPKYKKESSSDDSKNP